MKGMMFASCFPRKTNKIYAVSDTALEISEREEDVVSPMTIQVTGETLCPGYRDKTLEELEQLYDDLVLDHPVTEEEYAVQHRLVMEIARRRKVKKNQEKLDNYFTDLNALPEIQG
jgi:hypothetical protein